MPMEDFMEQAMDLVRTNRASLERERERVEMMSAQVDAMEMLMERVAMLEREREDAVRAQTECENRMARMQKERDALAEENKALSVKLKEMGAMMNKVAKKTDQDDLIDVLRKYMKSARRKDIGKRSVIKMLIFELTSSAKRELPDNMREELETFDDVEATASVTVEAGAGALVQVSENGVRN